MADVSPDRLNRVLERIDQLNRQDPHTVLVGQTPQPWEYVYSQWLTEWVLRLNPQASELLRIAARGQHVRRWTIPRSRYPMNRAGYLRWRETLKAFHADTIAGLMREEDYPDDAIQRVRTLMGKRQLGSDPETQTLEDALCLVFLETQFADLRRKTSEEKMREIVRKTWGKMSERARAEALKLPLNDAERRFVLDTVESP